MSSLISMSAPLNQGGFGSCVGHAFGKAVFDGLFGVPMSIKGVHVCTNLETKIAKNGTLR